MVVVVLIGRGAVKAVAVARVAKRMVDVVFMVVAVDVFL